MSSTQELTQMGSQKSFDEIPPELLVIIFNCIDFRTQLKAQLVCKRWHELIETSILKTTSVLIRDHSGLDDSFGHELHEISFKDLFVIKICEFNITTIRGGFETIIQKCVKKFANVKTLYVHLEHSGAMNDDLNLLEWVSNSCDSEDLLKLCIRCTNMLPITQTTADKLSKFEKLEVFQCENCLTFRKTIITKDCVQRLFKNWPNLKAIRLDGVSYREDKRHLGKEFKYLSGDIECLRMDGTILNHNSLSLLANRPNNQLKALIIDRMKASKHRNLMNTIGKFQSLSSLSISVDYEVYNEIDYEVDYELIFTNISKLVHLKDLYLINFYSEQGIDYNHLKYLESCSALQTLHLDSCSMTSTSTKAIPLFLKKISKIELYFTYGIYGSHAINEFIAPLVEIEGLKELTIYSQPKLTDVMVNTLLKNCRQLSKLEIHFGNDITTDAINQCKQLAHNRKIGFTYSQV